MKRLLLLLILCALPAQAIAEWVYKATRDPMSPEIIRSARVTSVNPVAFRMDEGGPQTATLLLNDHPRRGRSIVLHLPSAGFACRSGGCVLTARFDDKPPVPIEVDVPQDQPGNVVLILEAKAFASALRGAHRLRVEARFAVGGTKVIEFVVSGLKSTQGFTIEETTPGEAFDIMQACFKRIDKASLNQAQIDAATVRCIDVSAYK